MSITNNLRLEPIVKLDKARSMNGNPLQIPTLLKGIKSIEINSSVNQLYTKATIRFAPYFFRYQRNKLIYKSVGGTTLNGVEIVKDSEIHINIGYNFLNYSDKKGLKVIYGGDLGDFDEITLTEKEQLKYKHYNTSFYQVFRVKKFTYTDEDVILELIDIESDELSKKEVKAGVLKNRKLNELLYELTGGQNLIGWDSDVNASIETPIKLPDFFKLLQDAFNNSIYFYFRRDNIIVNGEITPDITLRAGWKYYYPTNTTPEMCRYAKGSRVLTKGFDFETPFNEEKKMIIENNISVVRSDLSVLVVGTLKTKGSDGKTNVRILTFPIDVPKSDWDKYENVVQLNLNFNAPDDTMLRVLEDMYFKTFNQYSKSTITTFGNPVISPGDVLYITKSYDNREKEYTIERKYWVESVTTTCDDGGWRQRLDLDYNIDVKRK